MQPLDPLGPTVGLLFEAGSSDYVLNVLSTAGIPTNFTLTEADAYSHKTRKRAYRRQMAPILAAFDQLTRNRIAENLAKEMTRGQGASAQRLPEVLASVGWAFENNKLVALHADSEVSGAPDPRLNLTEEQRELLRVLVDVYNTGCRSEFLLVRAHGRKPTLVYLSGCHPDVEIDANETDFDRLRLEGLVDTGKNPSGDLRGKPTARGINAVLEYRGRPAVALVERTLIQQEPRKRGKIFIGHGRSQEWRVLKDLIQDRLKLPWDEFNREPAAGLSTQQRIQEMLDNALFAFIIMTAEDEHADGSRHPRENVIHEAGLFQGRLGFARAIILLEEGCAEFSNLYGLVHIRFPHGNISAAFEEVRRVLEREKLVTA